MSNSTPSRNEGEESFIYSSCGGGQMMLGPTVLWTVELYRGKMIQEPLQDDFHSDVTKVFDLKKDTVKYTYYAFPN
jgi:hypothetical protein